ncbi:MAG: DUF1080 domain-containing protein [Armatimonadetes bacterium]|nr:DUF1080 domain-containing protein [Armatimonadota bacterium]
MSFHTFSTSRPRTVLLVGLAVGLTVSSVVLAAAPLKKKFNPNPPRRAVVLFNGNDLSQWVRAGSDHPARWRIEDGAMVVSRGNIASVPTFKDFQLHLEFNVPYEPNKKGQGRGNSGVFLQGLYEIQVLDSWNNETYADGACGAIYGQHPPRVNASLPPGQWQTYDVLFTAPRFEEKGEVARKARATVYHNGILIHDNVELQGARPSSAGEDRIQAGPIVLQDHGNPVRYRNIWVSPLPVKK